jgi:DNA polymerase
VSDPQPPVPEGGSLDDLREAAPKCRACPLWEPATQVVFGEGPQGARLVLVGEQPGDKEDQEGRPFVGPAGRELARGLEAAGIDRDEAYVTNAVKHFKFEERGKRRIHQKPNARETKACRPWLDAELDVIAPDAVVALGATAAQALLGRDFKVSKMRGELVDSDLAPLVSATIHPSAILRTRGDEERGRERERFAEDLAVVAKALSSLQG